MTTEYNKSKITPDTHEKIICESQKIIEALKGKVTPEVRARMQEVIDFRTSITGETDRGAVLMSAAFLDDKLKGLLQKTMVQDQRISRRAFDFNGSLGNFSSRIDLAYLLGILPKNAQRDLHTIRAIRNQFAHQAAPLSYDDQKVRPLCDKLIFHGVKDAANAGSKFRRSVMGLLAYITIAFDNVVPKEAALDYAIPDRTEAYQNMAKIFTEQTGMEYPLKHHHE